MGNFRSIRWMGVLITAIFAGELSAAVPKKSTPFAPAWAKKSYIVKNQFNPYLNSDEVLRNSSLPERFFDAQEGKRLCELKQSYELQQAKFEARRNYGLTKAQDEERHNKSMQEFSRNAMTGLAQTHAKVMSERVKDYAEDAAPEAREPVAIAAIAASLYSGRPFKFRLGEVKTESRVDAKDRQASFSMLLPGIRPSVRYEGNEVSGNLKAAVMPNVEAVLDSAQKGTASVQYNVSF